jgi:dihydropyrimidinase
MRRPHELVIRDGTVVNADGQQALDVAITDGRISALVAPDSPLAAERELDASGCLVMPGGIDTHTHARWPFGDERTHDGFEGTGRAAALGGTTTLIDFIPQLDPGQRLLDAAHDRIDEIEAGSPIDVGLHPILNRVDDGVLADIGAVIEAGMTSFKMYTTYEDKRVDDGEIWILMQEIARHGGLPGFHAENHDIIGRATEQSAARGRFAMRNFPETRPALAEATMIETVSLMARNLGCAVYIFHVSGTEALDAVIRGNRDGGHAYAETCTHYLALDDSVFERADGWKFVITPPIRAVSDQRDVWDGIADGVVVSVGSDHCAYPATAKNLYGHDHRLVPPGAPGVEHRTPVLWDQAVNRRGMTPSQFVDISSARAARTLGMYPRKGVLAVGSDADLIVLDPARRWVGPDFAPAIPETFSLYDEYEGAGVPTFVFSRGTLVVDDRRYVGRAGAGSFVARDRHPAPGATATVRPAPVCAGR